MPDVSRGVWSKPELVAVARNRPEEAVLAVCKAYSPKMGPDSMEMGCYTEHCSATCSSYFYT
jgi:hypothetical protein